MTIDETESKEKLAITLRGLLQSKLDAETSLKVMGIIHANLFITNTNCIIFAENKGGVFEIARREKKL